jgi:hypothetical protein
VDISPEDSELARESAARRSACGIESEDIICAKLCVLRRVRRLDQKRQKRKQVGRGFGPFGSKSSAAAMVLATVTVAELKRNVRRCGCGGLRVRRMRHRVTARHLRRSGLHESHRAHAVHRARLCHRQRPKGRDEHDQQQTLSRPATCRPTISSPHLSKSIAEKQSPVVKLPVGPF